MGKCEFLQASVHYLGFLVSSKGIQANDKGMEAVRDFPVPDKVHGVRSFLGLCSYFKRFIKDFSMIAKLLYELLKKDKEFVFEEKELQCF